MEFNADAFFSIVTFVGGGVASFIALYFTILKNSNEVKAKNLQLEKDIFRWDEEKKKLQEENKELKVQLHDLSSPIVMRLSVISGLQELIYKMFEETSADRFILFVANNGKTDFNRTTAILEQHRFDESGVVSIGATKRYVNFRFDDTYRNMLKRIETVGMDIVYTEEMKESDLRNIYEYENVVASKIFFILREHVNPEHDRIWYASVATHHPEGFTHKDETALRAYKYQIQELLQESLRHHISDIDNNTND